ncbi:MAG TPA: hypothetical protein VFB78_03635 [Acidimicrobiales bacterium]|nr:hypothetical protein [Acidimicrobiales bacterium]
MTCNCQGDVSVSKQRQTQPDTDTLGWGVGLVAGYAEGGEAFGGLVAGLEAVDTGPWGPVSTPVGEGVDRGERALEDGLDGAVVAVVHRAGDAEAGRLACA